MSQKKSSPSTNVAPPKLWRQGDVFIVETSEIPDQATPRRPILAEGEVTGHAHRLKTAQNATVLSCDGRLFLSVIGDAVEVEHEEHATVTIPPGSYEIRIQREYHPEEIRRVVD